MERRIQSSYTRTVDVMIESPLYRDSRIRLAAFKWLEKQTAVHGDVLAWRLLAKGFVFEGRRVPIVSQQGIFKPAVLDDMPLSLRTSAKGPYDDHLGPDGRLHYAYRGTNPKHFQNVWVRNAMQRQVPLIYAHAVVPGKYLVTWPVYVVGDNPGLLTFSILADERAQTEISEHAAAVYDSPEAEFRRRYATRAVLHRLHQTGFRERVLAAYRDQCALCRLRHRELLEAAHIIGDKEIGGEPDIRNGLALCKLHHAAFDNFFLAIRPDYTVEVKRSILEESDGPMLRYGLQGLHNQRIWTPRSPSQKPDRDRLELRYESFLRAS